MSKVYCKDCKWFHNEDSSQFGYAPPHCRAETGKIIVDYVYGDYEEILCVKVDDPKYPNKRKTNGCKFYQPHWRKRLCDWIKNKL